MSVIHTWDEQQDLGHIAPDLRRLAVPIDDVLLDPENAREHDEENRAQVRSLLLDYGQLLPIIVRRATNHILKGNCTWEEAKELGWTHIAVLYADLDPTKAASFAIRDNRVPELGKWKSEQLRDILARLGDEGEAIDSYGWKPDALQLILAPTVTTKVEGISNSFINSLLTTAEPRKSDEQLEKETGIRVDLMPEDRAAKPLKVTFGQREVIERAIEHMREETDDPNLSEGRAVELALADWLAGI